MESLSELPRWLVVGTGVALGLTFGSFLNVVIYRLPRGENLAHPGSRCPGCGRPIRAFDNIPVLSWLLLRGKARCCGTRISPRYPLVELLGGLVAWAILETRVFTLPSGAEWWRELGIFFVTLTLALGLIAAAFVDLEHMVLPDEITLGGTVLGLATTSLRNDVGWVEAVLSAAIGFLSIWLLFDVLYRRLRGHPGMGLGDAKLVMLAGAWFGVPGAAFALLGGAVQGTLVALVVLVVRGRIDEPEAVVQERAALREAIEQAEGEERLELERELALDPIGHEPGSGFGQMRLAFGPFLVLALLEYLLVGDLLRSMLWPPL